jgi:outer membrane efflux protein
VDIPIFDFGRRKAAVRASQQGAASAEDSLKAIDLELRNSISQAFHQIIDYDEQIASLRTDVVKATNAVALAEAQRGQGLIDELSLVEAQLQVPLVQISLGQVQLLRQLKYAELRDLSGGIWNWLDDTSPAGMSTATPKPGNSSGNLAKVMQPANATSAVNGGGDKGPKLGPAEVPKPSISRTGTQQADAVALRHRQMGRRACGRHRLHGCPGHTLRRYS